MAPQTASKPEMGASVWIIRCGLLNVGSDGDPLGQCPLSGSETPCARTLFLLLCCHRDCQTHSRPSERDWGLLQLSLWVSTLGLRRLLGCAEPGSHLATHAPSETQMSPTSELSMLLSSAKCPVRSRTFLQGLTPAPSSSRVCPGSVRRMLFFCIVLIF